MKETGGHIIFTIGHSTHSFAGFLAMLQSFNIRVLADIRRLPGSRKYPQFDRDTLQASLEAAGIQYVHLEDLGGRRKGKAGSKNNRWRNESFKGYADYMETEAFEEAIGRLEQIALEQPTAYMCSEAVWWRCHRSMVSDYLKAKGWTVLHMMAPGKATEHPYTSPAKIVNNRVCYADDPESFNEGNMANKFKVGDKVSWNSEAGHVSGTIIKVHTKDFDYKGYTHHASKDNPQYEIKSSKTDHIAVHKETALTKS